MSKLKIIALCIVAAIIILLFFRVPGNAQEDIFVQEIAAEIASSTTRLGFDTQVKVVGRFGETGLERGNIIDSNQSFYLSNAQGTEAFTISEFAGAIAEQSGIDQQEVERQMLELIEANIDDVLLESSWIVEVVINGKQSYIVVTDNGQTFGGAFATLTRSNGFLYNPGYRSDLRNGRREECAFKQLTRDFLGRTAEWARVCTRTVCASGQPTQCEFEKTSGSKPFGNVTFDPEDRMEEGQVYRNLCTGTGQYTWSLAFLGITWNGEEYSIPGLSFKEEGSITSNTLCF